MLKPRWQEQAQDLSSMYLGPQRLGRPKNSYMRNLARTQYQPNSIRRLK